MVLGSQLMPKPLTHADPHIFPNGASGSAKKLDNDHLSRQTAPRAWPQPVDALHYLNPHFF